MKRLLLCIGCTLILLPLITEAHPGKTMEDGCHFCWANCGYWGVPDGQLHCHDETPKYSVPRSRRYTPPATSFAKPLCTKFGVGAFYNNTSGQCECISGYTPNTLGTRCIGQHQFCQELDGNAEWSAAQQSCVCREGYKPDISGRACIVDPRSRVGRFTPREPSPDFGCPANAYVPKDNPMPKGVSRCFCLEGYKANESNTACILDPARTPYTSTVYGYTDHCDDAFRWCRASCSTTIRNFSAQSVCKEGCETGAQYCEREEKSFYGCWAFRVNCENTCEALDATDEYVPCIQACRQSYQYCY